MNITCSRSGENLIFCVIDRAVAPASVRLSAVRGRDFVCVLISVSACFGFPSVPLDHVPGSQFVARALKRSGPLHKFQGFEGELRGWKHLIPSLQLSPSHCGHCGVIGMRHP